MVRRKGYGRASGAGTIINAIATFKGAAFGLDPGQKRRLKSERTCTKCEEKLKGLKELRERRKGQWKRQWKKREKRKEREE